VFGPFGSVVCVLFGVLVSERASTPIEIYAIYP